MSERVKLPDSTQLDTLNGKLESINTTLAGQEFVTAENVKSALGYPPDDDEYELIAKYEPTEDSDYFYVNGLNLKKIIVAVNRVPSADAVTTTNYCTSFVSVKCSNGSTQQCKTAYISFNDVTTRCWAFSAEIKGVAMACDMCYLNNTTNSGWDNGHCDAKREVNWIPQLSLGTLTPQAITGFSIHKEKAITAGSTVVVYGVRVKEAST